MGRRRAWRACTTTTSADAFTSQRNEGNTIPAAFRMDNGASPQPDEACLCGLRSEARAPAGVQGSHNMTVHSPLAAVGWPLPAEPRAGAHHDATAYCRAGPVRSRDAGGPLHRPDAADLP